MNIRQLLVTRRIYDIICRWGPRRLRAAAFDEKFRSGTWRFPPDEQLASVLRRYLGGGDLLLLGCGGACVLNVLKPSELRSVLGVDISKEAIRLASRFSSNRVSFQVADMVTFECPQSYDVILFSESLYYVRARQRAALLRRLGGQLKANGVFLVTVSKTISQYLDLLAKIRRDYTVVEDSDFPGSSRHYVVFRT